MPLTELSFDFLMENMLMNSRDWFHENKPRYQNLVETPMLELSEALYDTMFAIDPHMTLVPKRTLSRIWKDMRYNKGSSIFREVMWLVFRRGKGMEYPAYYFEVSPSGFRYGVGYFSTPPAVMELLRRWILSNDARYTAARQALTALPAFHLIGEKYKRNRHPDAPAEKQDWLNRKQLIANCDCADLEALAQPELPQVLSEAFTKLAPMYELLLAAHLEVLGEGGSHS